MKILSNCHKLKMEANQLGDRKKGIGEQNIKVSLKCYNENTHSTALKGFYSRRMEHLRWNNLTNNLFIRQQISSEKSIYSCTSKQNTMRFFLDIKSNNHPNDGERRD